MKNMLGLTEPLQSERSKTAARKLVQSIPTDLEIENISTQDLSMVIINVEHEVRETSQNTDLYMLEEIEPLQRIQGELANIDGKLTAINEHIEHEQQKLDVIANDATYTDEQRKEVQHVWIDSRKSIVINFRKSQIIKNKYKPNLSAYGKLLRKF